MRVLNRVLEHDYLDPSLAVCPGSAERSGTQRPAVARLETK